MTVAGHSRRNPLIALTALTTALTLATPGTRMASAQLLHEFDHLDPVGTVDHPEVEEGWAVAASPDGDVYYAPWISGNPSELPTHADVTLIAYHPDGTIKCPDTFPPLQGIDARPLAASQEKTFAVYVADDGFVYVAGATQETTFLSPYYDWFIMRFDAQTCIHDSQWLDDGVLIWGTPGEYEEIDGLYVDSDSIYASGWAQGKRLSVLGHGSFDMAIRIARFSKDSETPLWEKDWDPNPAPPPGTPVDNDFDSADGHMFVRDVDGTTDREIFVAGRIGATCQGVQPLCYSPQAYVARFTEPGGQGWPIDDDNEPDDPHLVDDVAYWGLAGDIPNRDFTAGVVPDPDGDHFYAAGYEQQAAGGCRQDLIIRKFNFIDFPSHDASRIYSSGSHDLTRAIAVSPDGGHLFVAANRAPDGPNCSTGENIALIALRTQDLFPAIDQDLPVVALTGTPPYEFDTAQGLAVTADGLYVAGETREDMSPTPAEPRDPFLLAYRNDLLFADGFELNNLEAWTGTSSEPPQVNSVEPLDGAHDLLVEMANQMNPPTQFVKYKYLPPPPSLEYRGSFLFKLGTYPDGGPLFDGNFRQEIFKVLGHNPNPGVGQCHPTNPTTSALRVWLYMTGGRGQNPNIQLWARGNRCGERATLRIPFDKEDTLRICFQVKLGEEESGELHLYVDPTGGSCPDTVGGTGWVSNTISNDRIGEFLEARMGLPLINGFGRGEFGTLYFDDFESYSTMTPPAP